MQKVKWEEKKDMEGGLNPGVGEEMEEDKKDAERRRKVKWRKGLSWRGRRRSGGGEEAGREKNRLKERIG